MISNEAETPQAPPYLEANQAVWSGHWARVVVLQDGCPEGAGGPQDEPLGWVWVLRGGKVARDETEEAY